MSTTDFTDDDCTSVQYRKFSHLAGCDVMEKPILTISKAVFSNCLQVNGRKSEGYEIHFVEDSKPMIVNSGNRKEIVKQLMKKGLSREEAQKVKNWIGLSIQLYFEPNRSFGGEKTGGIGIVKELVVAILLDVTSALAALNLCTTLEQLTQTWTVVLTPAEKADPRVLALKEKLKLTLK